MAARSCGFICRSEIEAGAVGARRWFANSNNHSNSGLRSSGVEAKDFAVRQVIAVDGGGEGAVVFEMDAASSPD